MNLEVLLQLALLQGHHALLGAQAAFVLFRRRRNRRTRSCWVRPWLLAERRHQHGHYDRLLAELKMDILGAFISDVTPDYGSLGGETRLTIYGRGFSTDQFSQNEDPNTGNFVFLVSESGTRVNCSVHKDGSTETQIMCYTPERMSEENYYVKAIIDGVAIEDADLCGGDPISSRCTYKPVADYTPTIDSITPQSGLPGDFVIMTGQLFTDRYGSNVPEATNERQEKLLRVYAGPQDCALKDGDVFFGLSVEEDSDFGYLTCKTKGTSVGFFNDSFIIESPYGRSLPDPLVYRVSYNDQIYMHQTYTDITSISPSSGSTEGGLSLTIYGNYFDNRAPYTQPRVFVGDTICEVTRVEVDEFIECTVAADPSDSASEFQGNRGIKFEYWTSTSKTMSNIDDILTMTDSDAGYNTEFLDETFHEDVNDTMDTYVSRMRMYFTPPHDGDYQFQLYADDGAKLFVDGAVRANSTTDNWGYSDRIPLLSNNKYLLEVIHFEATGGSIVHVMAKHFDTHFTSAWTKKAEQEEQTISITSTIVYDVQELSFSGFVNQTATNEVQTIVIYTPGSFRLGLFGVYSEPLNTGADETMVSNAINALPIWGPEESVIVLRMPAEKATFEFTFDSKRGDFPMIDVIKVGNDSDVTVIPSEDVKGVPDLDTISLTLEGVISKPISLSTLTADTLASTLDEMFGARCPKVFETLKKSFESFEMAVPGDTFSGTRVKDTEPFCGRYSLKNPWKIFGITEEQAGIMLTQHNTLCFAYKGIFQDSLWILYSYTEAETLEVKSRRDRYSFSFNKDSNTESNTWYYTCINVLALVLQSRPDDSEHRLEAVYAARLNSDVDAYVDAVFVGPDVTTEDIDEINRRRLPPAMPNGTLINTVTVTSSETNVYTVTLNPFDCGNRFPLFELTNGDVSSGVTASPSTAASYKLSSSNAGTLSVRRTAEASPPVEGTINITFNANTKSGLNVALDAVDFGKELESLTGIGDLSATKTGSCAGFDLRVTFESLPGDLPEMTITGVDLTGIDPAAAVWTNVDGGLLYDPLTGDMVSTVETDPQVRMYINDVPTKCSGDCSFQWDSSVTPTVTSVTPESGTSALGTSITIGGTKFSSTLADNLVTIGDVGCSVTGATTTSITCDVGNGPVGEHKVIVNVAGKGFASHDDGDVIFSYTADITGITPSTGSLGGGGLLTISGYGFKDGAAVTVGTGSCDVTEVSPEEIKCYIPSADSSDVVTVTVTQGSTALTYLGYTYDANLTATVTSISPSTLGVTGGTVTITGSTFGGSGSVYIGSQEAEVTSYNDTQIIAEVGAVEAGSQPLKVETADGFALDGSGSIPTVDVELSVTNVHPLHGSLQGGTRLTVTGVGFGSNDSLVDVSVGDFSCDVETVRDTQIVCQIENAARVHAVTNRGIHKTFGVFYAFDQPQLTIECGDIVHWSWETPDFVNDINHAIIEVDSPSSTTAKEGGFKSGTPSRTGVYQYQFTELGTYYVWSGYVDKWGLKNYAGQIQVTEKLSSVGVVTVTVAGKEALQDVGGSSDPVDSTPCQSVTSAKTRCTDSMPSGGDPDKFNFAFWSCSTPVVDSVSQQSGTVQTQIMIDGEGFSTTDCQNEISFGDYPCDVVSSAENSVTCTVGRDAEIELGILHPLSVMVGNRGYALINIVSVEDSSFGLIPNIETISPTSGSMAGGAVITITGFGFGDSAMVYIDGYTCAVLTNSYTQITCKTPMSNSEMEKTVEVHAMVNGSPLPAACETSTMTCRYSYASLWTPVVSSIDPDTLSSNTTFTITGSNFGADTSALEVFIGNVSATIVSSDDTTIVATVQNTAAGDNDVIVRHVDNGRADGDLVVTGTAVITNVAPSSGSIHGETEITISGNGFVAGDTAVILDGSPCSITSVSLSEVTCSTPSHTVGTVDIIVTSNSVEYSPESFTYDTGFTPTVSSISPTSGLPGDNLTISGSNLAGGSVSVLLDDVPCSVVSGSSSQIVCTVGAHATGLVPVYVHVENLGASNVNEFEYTLELSGVNPSTGGTAGGQTLTLTGQGFSEDITATICGQTCSLKETTSWEYQCTTPANSAQTCDVVVSVNGLTKTLSSSYTYDAGLTPTISGVIPSRGGTGGGTTITVSGSGFGSSSSDVTVTIDGSRCTVTIVTNTELECVTGPHPGSVVSSVAVEVSGNGIAEESSPGDSEFSYIDVWSSSYTWGGLSPPVAGEFVVIPAGMTLLLDTDTPVLSFLLIQGGKLIFDAADIELQANIIMITDGGLLQVGTEEEPFQHKAIITLHGHHRSKELPIYGTKVLAVRNGSLELHGKEVPLTWTKLSATASVGDTTISLVHPVEWNIGDEIVVAATGHHHSQSENEKKSITDISEDKMTLTLDSALEAEHLGTEETFDGTVVEFRAEVGLLTHNVVVRGNPDPDWEEEIEACPDGFNTAEFATQTCFLGRFGDEIGSSQFGGMILVHAPEKDTYVAEARLSYIEVTFAGQAFRLGRYPVHFHLNGDMSTSYVRGLGIHHTFNRAVNIHGTHNTLVEKTVIYNIMGGAMFLEDGIETGNTFQYNLAVFVRDSSSLLNDDVTPASFWVTNPNNTIQHNAAVGGSHFGYWYRMHKHPDGPSFTEDVCPIHVPLGVFQNNSAHSFGWFGLWIFPDYFPMDDPCAGTTVEPAVFRSLTAWNNEKGAEAVNSGALQFDDFVLVQNLKAGYEGKKVIDIPQYTDDSAMISNSLIVGTTTVAPDNTQGCTKGGIVLPYGAGFRVKNVRFVNFDDSNCAAFRWARIDGTCTFLCGGYNYHVEGVSFINAPNKAFYDWEWEGVLIDKDGSLTGKSDNEWKVIPTTDTLPDTCEAAPDFSINLPASICPPQYKFHRYAFNNIVPKSLEGKSLLITNQYGTSVCGFAAKRLTHKPGWMCDLIDGETYKFEFEDGEQITNISYSGAFYEFEANDYIAIRLAVKEFPDRFSFDGGETFVNATLGGLDPATAVNGDWEWDNANSEIKFVVHGTKRTKRGGGTMSLYEVDRPLKFTSYKCYYTDCIPPPDPNKVPPKSERPAVFDYWSDSSLWNVSEDGYVTNSLGSYGVPEEYDNVRIEFDTWVVVNSTINKLGTLILEGVVEFANYPPAVYELSADYIIIKGGRLIIGWPDEPFEGLASIILRGNQSSPYYIPSGDSPTVGSKAIAVFGGLDLFGKDVGITWTKLTATATAGDNQITLRENVTWAVGDEIVIGATRFDQWETEAFQIEAISEDGFTLTLNNNLQYDHIVHSETFSSGDWIDLAAPVGLLTRNIKIIGEEYDDIFEDAYGARVLVGLLSTKDQTYTGYARLSNVEFIHTGQDGFTETYDARFSVAYIATGTVSKVKPSSVTKCSFHDSFNSAVGAFGIGGLNITDNIVYGSLGSALVTNSDDTRVVNNMVALVMWTGTYLDRYETFNIRWEAGIEAIDANNLTLQDNMVAGSERIGYHVKMLDCEDTSGRYSNNHGYSNLIGVGILPEDQVSGECAMYSGFVVWKSHDFGLYYQNTPSVKMDSNVVVESRQGIWTGVLGPNAVAHQIGNKFVVLSNNLLVGATSSFDCDKDVSPENGNLELSPNARPVMAPSKGMIGMVFPNFMQASNKAPLKKFPNIMAYNTIAGLMSIKNMTFAHYGDSCLGDYAVATNGMNDDLQHPIESEGITLDNVDDDYKIVYHRPNTGKINSADCVDMDCDAFKKALFKDLDGSFLGHVGAVIPQSEFEWDENPVRGLGDYRIPKEMVTDMDGNKIPYEEIVPYKGVIRNDNCTYRATWQAYECFPELNYEMLVIESMDADTEIRRLSPVAILGNGYVDLINGPQDHGWCSGYTCRKRVSLFHALVATDEDYLVHFTSVTPDHMRYMLLNADPEDVIKLTVWYSKPNRLDVFVDGDYVQATNARLTDGGNYVLDMPEGDEFAPTIADPVGTNFFDKDKGQLSMIIKGGSIIEVLTQKTVIVSFTMPALSEEDFFGDSIIENLASFLNIPLTKVRVVSVVSASGSRRKRSTGIVIEVEIGDEPSSSVNVTVSDTLDYSALLELAAEIVSECQVGDISSSFNISGGCNSVTVPAGDPADEPIVYSTPTPDHLVFAVEPEPEYEGVPLKTQPQIRVQDIANDIITDLGTAEYPWQLTASLQSGTGHPNAMLNGTLQVNASNGLFTFTDLSISHMGTGYILDFNVTSPDAATNFSISSEPFDVDGRPLKAHVVSKTSGDITKNSRFSITLDLRDENTDEIITDIAWRDHTWTAEVSALGDSKYGDLTGVLTATFNPTSGQALFPDLNITGFGIFYVQFLVVSSPADFNFTVNYKLNIMNPAHVGMVAEEEYEIEVKFDVDFDKVLSTEDKQNEFEQMILSEYANLWPDVRIKSGNIKEGSIVVTFVIDGSLDDVNSTAYSVCESISNSTTYSFDGYDLTLSSYMSVNNVSFYGVSCGEIVEEETTTEESLSVAVIVVIALVCFIVMIIVIGVVVWYCKSKEMKANKAPISVKPWKMGSQSDLLTNGAYYLGHSEKKIKIMSRENTFNSMSKAPSEVGSPRNPYFLTNYLDTPSTNVKAPLATEMYKEPLPGTPPTPRLVEPFNEAPSEDSSSDKTATPPLLNVNRPLINGTRRPSKSPSIGTGSNPYTSAPMKVIKFHSRVVVAANSKKPKDVSPAIARTGTPQTQTHSPYPGEHHERIMTPIGDNLISREPSPNGSSPLSNRK